MRNLSYALATMIAVFAGSTAAPGAQNILSNGSMERGEGGQGVDPHVPLHWVLMGNVPERSDEANLVPVGEGHSLKAFSSSSTEGAYQNVAALPGEVISISAQLYTRSEDKLSGDAEAGINLEFLDAGDDHVGFHSLIVLDVDSPADTWIPGSIASVVAPAGTATARITCFWRWFGSATGSAYWDDCHLTIDAGTNALLNADFEQAGPGEQSSTGIDDWLGFNNQEKSSEQASHGVSSVKIGTEDTYSGLYQDMGVLEAGDHILLKAKILHPSSDPLTGGVAAGVKLEFFDTVPPDLPPPVENLAFGKDSSTNSWELVEVSTSGLVVPEDASQARIVMVYVSDDAGSNGSVYFDAAHAAYESAPGTNLLLNGLFEDGEGGANGLDHWSEFGGDNSSAQKSTFEVPGYPDEALEACLKATGTEVAGLQQDISVTPGESLTLRAYLRKRPGDLIGTARAGVKVEWRGGSTPDHVDLCAAGQDNCITAGDAQDQWIDLTVDYTMPAGMEALARFTNLVAFAGAGTSGTVYIDACEAVVLNRFDGTDADGDYDEDLYDFAEFQRCFSGDGVIPLKWNCTVFDVDEDNDIDDWDYQSHFCAGTTDCPRLTGPN